MEWTQKELEELYQKAVQKASTDREFRKELLADSNAALEKLAGKKLPEGMRLKFIEQDPAYTGTVVLPNAKQTEEMSQDDLELVSGGLGCPTNIICMANLIPVGPGNTDLPDGIPTCRANFCMWDGWPIQPCQLQSGDVVCTGDVCGADT